MQIILTMSEFKELISQDTKKPLHLTSSIDVKVKAKSDDTIRPITIGDKVITKLGVYDIQGIKFWIIKS